MSLRIFSLLILSISIAMPLQAEVYLDQDEAGLQNLKNMAGCFELTYRFMETGNDGPPAGRDGHDEFYDFLSTGREWITLTESNDDQYIVEHFFHTSHGDFVAHHHAERWTLGEGNTWEQYVYYLDDYGTGDEVPRYTCSGAWNLGQRKCVAPGAGRPQRHKYQGRKYATIDRDHTVHTTSKGWIQLGRNVIRDEHVQMDGIEVVKDSAEVGWIEYRKVDGAKAINECFSGKQFHESAEKLLKN